MEIQSCAGSFFAEKHWHPVVNKAYFLREAWVWRTRLARRRCGKMLAMCHVHQPTLPGTDGILYLAAIVALPFNIVAGGNQATPLTHAVSEQHPACGGFAGGVNESLAIGQQVAPAHGEGRGHILRLLAMTGTMSA